MMTTIHRGSPFLLFSLIVSVASGTSTLGGATVEDYHVPIFSVKDLEMGNRRDELLEVLRTTGLISVVGTLRDQESFKHTRRDGLLGLCRCLGDKAGPLFHSVNGVDSAVLSDGTKRTTLATATIGETPLALPEQEILDAGCTSETVHFMEKLRDQVAWVSHTFVTTMDRYLAETFGESSEKALLHSKNGKAFPTFQSIVQHSQNLEHFHIYDKNKHVSVKNTVLDVHTDAGLFLVFVPGHQCNGDDLTYTEKENTSSDFYVMVEGSLKRAIFSSGSVGVMLGVGAEHWLRTPTLVLRATRHAVQMEAGQSRAWYGMMHTVPADSIVQDLPERTFADMRRSMVLNSKQRREYGDSETDDVIVEDISIGCGQSSSVDSVVTDIGDTRINRRRLGTVEDGTTCNNVTNFFCWMSCLDIPQADRAIEYIDEGFSLYCLDPATLASSGNKVSAAYEECQGGFVHNAVCLGQWVRTAPGVPAYEVFVDEESRSSVEEKFCFGGTSMYMDGFHWTDSVCVIYLFPEWILESAGSMVGACVGTLLFGIVLEGVIWKRRDVVQSFQAGWTQLGVSSFVYGIQLTLGYMLMLVVMTYSGPLFMCVIFGLMGGHFIFNAITMKKDQKKKEQVLATETGCCCEGDFNTSDGDDDSGELPTKPSIPEGITPCCQNKL